MAKTKAELTRLKEEYEALNNKLKELSDDELNHVIGGRGSDVETAIEPGSQNPKSGNGAPKLGNTPRTCRGPVPGSDKGGRFMQCSDKNNKGSKPDCDTCYVRDSTR